MTVIASICSTTASDIHGATVMKNKTMVISQGLMMMMMLLMTVTMTIQGFSSVEKISIYHLFHDEQ